MDSLFELNLGLESTEAENSLETPMTEGTSEMKDNCPSMNPTQHFDAANSGEHGVAVPGGDKETPNAKPYDANSVSIPGGDNEKPTAKPADGESGVPNPAKILLDEDTYNSYLAQIQKSFKEGVDALDMIMNAKVETKSLEAKQNEFVESAMDEAFVESMCSGPIFEAVTRTDKGEVKDIVNNIRTDVINFVKDQDYKMYKPALWARAILGAAFPMEACAAIAQIWNTRLWQVLGIAVVEPGNAKDLAKAIEEKFGDELGDYKILLHKAPMTFIDLFRTKFKYKREWEPHFVLVDKKMPSEITKGTKAADNEYEIAHKEELKKGEEEKKEDKKCL